MELESIKEWVQGGYSEEMIYKALKEAVKSLYKTSTKKYVIANYTSLQPTRKALGLKV